MSRRATRIETLKRRLASRTGADNKPLAGFAANVAEIKAELARLEAIDRKLESNSDAP